MRYNENMKLKTVLFGMIELLIVVAGIVHTAYSYIAIANDSYTSFPPQTAFLLFIPYIGAMCVVFLVWLATRRLQKHNKRA